MKSVLFLINDRTSIKTTGTNWTLLKACQSLGYETYVSDVTHLEARSATTLFAESFKVDVIDCPAENLLLDNHVSKLLSLSNLSAVFVRTTPGKDIARAWAHRFALEVLRLADELGVRVINNPAGLQKASSKLYSVYLPDAFVPKTKVCHFQQSVIEFANELSSPFVIKPLLGSQGRDVFFFENVHSPNLRQVIENLGQSGYVVVQEFLPESADGDIRVLTIDDQLIGGASPLGIRRTPASGEFRSNISLGGTASMVELTETQSRICCQIASQLASDGIRIAGLDLIGEKIVEVNVFSPSGLQEFTSELGPTFATDIVSTLMATATAMDAQD